jgi:multidrug resistance efflux pump
MNLENEALAAKDLIKLKHLAVNRPRDLIQTGHIFWIARKGHKIKIEAISSQSKLDKTTPFIQWITQELRLRAHHGELNNSNQWTFDNSHKETPFTYPFSQALYVPFAPDPKRGGLLLTREHPFTDIDHRLVKRLATLFGIVASVTKRKKRPAISLNKRLALSSIAAALAVISFVPVSMTTLAPAEIVAGQPHIITAPFDGVVEDIVVPPNMPVDINTPLLRFEDTAYQNEAILAKKEAAIAEAKLKQAEVCSFTNNADKHDIAIAEAEKTLANARQNYAQDRLAKTLLTSPKKGIAIYSDPADWRGKRVTTGEAIIQIVNPDDVKLRIEAPLSMGESLETGARIKLFLDNAPLKSFEAELVTASYYAQTLPEGHMAYDAYADLKLTDKNDLPRIGARGVAKIYGRKASLAYWLFRRPISLIRQTLGF